MRMIRFKVVQMFEYVMRLADQDYTPTSDAYEVAADELAELTEDPANFMANIKQEDPQVFLQPADKEIEYYAYPDDTHNPKKWSKRYREGMMRIYVPIIIVEDPADDEED